MISKVLQGMYVKSIDQLASTEVWQARQGLMSVGEGDGLNLPELLSLVQEVKASFDFLKPLQSDLACSICTDTVSPADWFLQNKYIDSVLEWVATEVCYEAKMEKEKSICKGGVTLQSRALVAAVAEGLFSP